MGRHAGREPRVDLRTRLAAWLERVLVGIGAAGVVAVVLRWAGTSVGTAVTVGLAVLVLVPAAAWVASTVPQGDDDEAPRTGPHPGHHTGSHGGT